MTELHVLCKVGDGDYAIAADDVVHMESFAGATPVPGALPWVVGLVQIRQQIIPLVDLRTRFGLPPVEPGPGARVVVVQVGPRTVGLLVDSAREVRNIAPEQAKPPPDVVAQGAGGFVRSVARLDDRIVMLLDARRVVGEAEDGQADEEEVHAQA